MDSSHLLLIIGLLFALFLLSAFFSGSETAFFSLSKSTIRSLRNRQDSRCRRVVKFLDHPRELLITLLIGNTIVNTAVAGISAIVADNLSRQAGFNHTIALALQILVVSFILIIIVEISPKVFALRHNERWALISSALIQLCIYIFMPATNILNNFVERLAKGVGVESTRTLFSDEELRTLAEVAEEHGVLEDEEIEMEADDENVEELSPSTQLQKTEMSLKRKWAWRSLGLGVALTAGGLGLSLAAVHANKRADDPGLINTTRKDYASRRDSYWIGAYVTYGLAAVAITTSLILFFNDEPEGSGSGIAVAPTLSPNAVGVSALLHY